MPKICDNGSCYYVNYKEEECNQHYSEDYARRTPAIDYEKCSNGEYAPASPPANPESPKPIYPGKSPVVVVPDVPEQSSKLSKTEQPYKPVSPEHPGTPKQPKTPESPENTTKPEAPLTTGSNETLGVLVANAGAAKKTFAGVAAAFAGLAFLL
ncbi:hypothetical protein H9L39_09710 [Fusarium oxysporum f. sp. albedinis]|nr:hypothetical protein H9L39_09710 [Fusarium oxysporum f. sp. albedinis]